MLFNSLQFAVFFPAAALIYFVIPKKLRCLWLLQVVPPRIPDFQIDTEVFEGLITPATKAVIVETSYNPSGVCDSA